jgi:2-iminobutanoate/2-iminopropanoate deaminase
MQHKPVPIFLAALLAAAPGCATRPSAPARSAPEYFADPRGQGLPFSDSVRVGDLLFLSGDLGAPPGSLEVVPGGIGPETRQTMENIKAKLARRGATMDDVVKCTVFLADVREWAAFNEVYRTYFTRHLPARSAFGANGLALGARVEVECIAVLPQAPR